MQIQSTEMRKKQRQRVMAYVLLTDIPAKTFVASYIGN